MTTDASVVIDAAFRSIGVQVAMHLEGGGVLVLSGMVALVCLESLKLGGVVTRLSLITDGLSLGQFLTVFGDVGFD